MEDTYRHKGLRQRLVNEIQRKGIKDEKVLDAINRVPRHFFMDSSFIKFSYSDQAFPIGSGQTISQPYTVAFQTELLDLKKRHKVLEVGTGSGYQAAILLELGARVFTIERHRELFIKTQSLLPDLGYKAHFFYGDGHVGIPSYAPYDRILVTAGAQNVPAKLLDQLKIGGIMVIPVGTQSSQKMIRVVKTSKNDYSQTEHGLFAFVPLVKGRAAK